MKKILSYIIAATVCLAAGFISSLPQADSIANWYLYLDKSALTPPNVVFPIAWGILYLLMGISIAMIYNTVTAQKKYLMTIFASQLFLNFMWSIIFFYMRSPGWALLNIIVLDILVILYAAKTYPVNRTASILVWPYIIWLMFATYLNLYIVMFN